MMCGFFMIIYPIFVYDKNIIFPSYNALLPCLGAAVLIYSGSAKYSSKLLNNRYMVHVGLISYSFYLIHWPVIVFYKYWKINELVILDKIVLFIASAILASLMYRYIEQPFRYGTGKTSWSNSKFSLASLLLVLLLVLPAANIWANNGWTWRYPQKLIEQLSFDPEHYNKYVWARLKKLNKGFNNTGKAKVLVIGDSMAADFVNILRESNNIDKFDLVTIPVFHDCKSVFPLSDEIYTKYLNKKLKECKRQHDFILNSDLIKQADSVVLASSWSGWNLILLDSTIRYLKDKGVDQVVVIGKKSQSMSGVKFIAKYAFRKSNDKIKTS